MFSIISGFLTAMLHSDEIEDGFDFLNDSSYLTQVIGFTFILELIASIVASIVLLIRKVVKH